MVELDPERRDSGLVGIKGTPKMRMTESGWTHIPTAGDHPLCTRERLLTDFFRVMALMDSFMHGKVPSRCSDGRWTAAGWINSWQGQRKLSREQGKREKEIWNPGLTEDPGRKKTLSILYPVLFKDELSESQYFTSPRAHSLCHVQWLVTFPEHATCFQECVPAPVQMCSGDS